MAATDPTKVISLDDLKAFMKISGSSKDTWLTSWRKTAVADIEVFMNMNIASTEYTIRVSGDDTNELDLGMYPITAVSAIQDFDGSDLGLEEAGVASDQDKDYFIPDKQVVAGIQPYYGSLIKLQNGTWEEGEGNYIVTFTAGFAEEDSYYDLPELILSAVKKYVDFLYGNWKVAKAKVGDIAYDYVENNGIIMPKQIGNALLRIIPPRIQGF